MIRPATRGFASCVLAALAWAAACAPVSATLQGEAFYVERIALPPVLVVERFINIETCRAAITDSPLRNTYWKLVRLGGVPVAAAERQHAPHLIFALDGMRVSGSGGCNSIAGSFELDGDKLHLSRIASIMMACPSGMELERRFLQSLEKVERYRIRGTRLDLLDASGAVIAGFEAAAPR